MAHLSGKLTKKLVENLGAGRHGDARSRLPIAPVCLGTDTINDFQDGVDMLGLADGLIFSELLIDDGGGSDTIISYIPTGEILAVFSGVTDDLITLDDTFTFV